MQFGMRAALQKQQAEVTGRITAACAKAGRDPSEVRLVWVAKYQPVEKIEAALNLGARIFGENKVQECLAKYPLPSRGAQALGRDYELHFIGHLQKNKVRKVLPLISAVHSVDTPELWQQIDRIAQEMGSPLPVFLQVNTSREASKSGFAPETLVETLMALPRHKYAYPAGLMTMGPTDMDPDKTRDCFRELAGLLRTLKAKTQGQIPGWEKLAWLSMGMTHDLEIAVEEGSHFVRVGTGLFGERPGGAA